VSGEWFWKSESGCSFTKASGVLFAAVHNLDSGGDGGESPCDGFTGTMGSGIWEIDWLIGWVASRKG